MSGHSKWASIKHKKGALDAKRGKIFTKIIKEIAVAARLGGGDPEGNPRLRTAIAAAKAENMPKDNIERAIKKGTGELEGVNYEETIYEGYGPAGVAVILNVLTDNKNRTVAEIRSLFAKNGGNLGEAGCVSWMFQKKGQILVAANAVDEERLMTIALDAGAEDMKTGEGEFEIITTPENFEKVKKAIDENKIPAAFAEVTMVPQSYIKLTGQKVQQMLHLMEVLEDHDDVQKVYANFDIPDEEMAKTS
ncbi:MAG: YebC/PmpR family DNA-binding transcriptional regulator [Nitrospinae bacterium]|nr:YebC/PmpR family DNA-binding transcriptional regulator [Nitrospinota bacterium]MBI3814883.1 YebC/PmpR family DNA-binding transcriptional regulator [Nitrospinota bacterium]